MQSEAAKLKKTKKREGRLLLDAIEEEVEIDMFKKVYKRRRTWSVDYMSTTLLRKEGH